MFLEPNIYAFAPHIFCIQNWRCNLYYLNLAYLIARSAPFIIQLLPICCRYIYANFTSETEGLEVRYVFSWPTYLIARSAPSCDLIICIPISCSEIGGAICIIMAGPFDYQK